MKPLAFKLQCPLSFRFRHLDADTPSPTTDTPFLIPLPKKKKRRLLIRPPRHRGTVPHSGTLTLV